MTYNDCKKIKVYFVYLTDLDRYRKEKFDYSDKNYLKVKKLYIRK